MPEDEHRTGEVAPDIPTAPAPGSSAEAGAAPHPPAGYPPSWYGAPGGVAPPPGSPTDATPPSYPPGSPPTYAAGSPPSYPPESPPSYPPGSPPSYPAGSPPTGHGFGIPAPSTTSLHPGSADVAGGGTEQAAAAGDRWGSAEPGPGPGGATGRPPSRRRTVMTVVAVVLVVALVVGGGVAYLISSGPGPVPKVSPAAQRILRSALKAAKKQGTFHYVSRSSSQGVTQVTVGDAGPTSGTQVITIGSDSFSVVVVGTACFFEGDAREMVAQLGLSAAVATAHAGQWISLSPSDEPYQSVYAAVTTPSALADNIDFVPHRRLGISMHSGKRVQGITGPLTNFTVAGVVQKAKGTASLFVTTSSPHLPVLYTEHGTISGQKSTFSMNFDGWGEPVAPQAPTAAVPFSSLGAASTPSGPPSLVSARTGAGGSQVRR